MKPQIKTQGIKYAGSKLKLLPQILSLVDNLEVYTVFDGFSGTTRVSQAFAQSGYRVISNDISEWSHILGTAYLKNRENPSYYQDLINHLNSLEGYDGWFTENYGGIVGENGNATQKDGTKKPWQIRNTKKLDAIRTEIDSLKLSEIERAVALTSLILAMDEVDSTMGHYASYLRKWSKRSYKKLCLKVPLLFMNDDEHTITQLDMDAKSSYPKCDLSYLDPPYGSDNNKMPASRVRYNSYYHLWTTIVRNDHPEIFGKVSRRKDSSDKVAYSPYEDFRITEDGEYVATKTMRKMVENVKSNHILLSYSNRGRVNMSKVLEIVEDSFKIKKIKEIGYKANVMTSMTWTNEWIDTGKNENIEYLILGEK